MVVAAQKGQVQWDTILIFLCSIIGLPTVYGPFMLGTEILPIAALCVYGGEWWQWAGVLAGYSSGVLACVFRAKGRIGLGWLWQLTAVLQFAVLLPVRGGMCSAAIGAVWLGARSWKLHCGAKRALKRGPMRILLVGDSFDPVMDGVATFTSQAIRYLSQQGHDVAVATAAPMDEAALKRSGARYYPIGGVYAEHAQHHISLPTYGLVRALFVFKPDVVHCFEGALPISLVTSVICIFLGVPHVVSLHTRVDLWVGELPNFPWFVVGTTLWIMGRCYEEAAAFMCVSRDLCELAAKSGLKPAAIR